MKIMKRVFLAALTMIAAAATLAGCAKKDDSPAKDIDVWQYVTLGEYKGLEIQAEPPAVDETEVKLLMDELYQEAVSLSTGVVVEDGIVDRAVETGDIVNIDYEGKKDGVAFQGGTAQGAYLTIGSGRFISGFEEGLEGATPGETRDLNLRFPDGYGNAELAGQEVVFTVTVNYILPEGYQENILAALALYGITSVTDEVTLEQYARDYLMDYAEQNYNSAVQNAVIAALVDQCAFESLPEDLVQKYEGQVRDGMEKSAAAQGMDVDAFCAYFYGMTLDELLEAQVPEIVKQSLAFQAVADREGFRISDEELDEMIPNGVLDGVDAGERETIRGDYREYFLYDKVLDYLIENAVITEQ